MNIVIVKSHFHSQGGIEKNTKRIAMAFTQSNEKNHVTLLTSAPPPEKISPLIQIASFPPLAGLGFLKLERFDCNVRRWLTNHPADIVFSMDRTRQHTHYRAGNGVHAAYLKSRLASEGIWKYALCQINPLHRKILELEKEGFEYSGLKTLFVNSHMVKKEVLSYYSVDPKKIKVIHNGVEWKEKEEDFLSWKEKKTNLLKQWGLSPDAIHFLFIGNGYRRKGLDILLQALAKKKQKNFHLCVVGKDKNIGWYQKETDRLKLQNQVRFFGSQENTTPFYQLADALIIPSFYDPFANVTLEALAMGLFVISSKTNGGHEILSSENGTVIENLLSPECLIAALETAFPKTEKSAEKIRASVSHLDFSCQLEKLVNLCV